MKKVYAVADSVAVQQELVRAASVLGEATVLVCKDEFLSSVSAVLEEIEAGAPDVVLTMNSRNGRLIAGLVAAQMGVTVLSDVSELTVDDAGVHAARLVYGGSAVRKESAAKAVVCVAPGAIVGEGGEAVVKEILAVGSKVKVVEKKAKEAATVDLGAAKVVVCAGRGVKDEGVLASLTDCAAALGAEMGCTRPIAEENHWMPRERYIGVSGAMLKPEVYLGVGVSGQMQHMVGVNDAGVIFAINKDKDALIFSNCDYGLVGDAAEILPKLAEKLKK